MKATRLVFLGIASSASLILATPGLSGAAPTLIHLSTDPYHNTSSQHMTEVEPDSFSFGNTIVSVFQVGRFFNGGASNIGWATSVDRGVTWQHGFLPGITVFAGGPYPRASDPSVAFDPKHGEWVVSYLALRVGGSPPQVVHTDLLASRSRDGLHWATPVIVALGPPGSFYDKNWTGCDTWATSPFYGRCYTEWDNAGNSNLALMSTSSDGGATWGPPTSPANKPFVIGGQPVALPNGTAVVPIIQFSRNFSNAWMASFISTNGGASWKASTRISPIQFHSPAGGLRADLPLPSAEVDQSGRVYVTWSDCRFEPSCSASDLVLTTSTDGVSWSPVRRIPLDPVGSGVDHFIPGIGVDRTTADGSANLAVTYYYYPNANCTTATCLLDVGMSVSTDGGVTWTPGQHVAGPMHLTWLPNTTLGYMVGDYVSTSLVPGDGAFGFFEVAAPPTGGTFHEDTFTAKRGLPGSSATSDQSAATTTGGSRVAAHWAG